MSRLQGLPAFMKSYAFGVVAATASMTFAGYMLLTGGGGAGISPQQMVAVRHVPVVSPLTERPAYAIVPKRRIAAAPRPTPGSDIITGTIAPVKTKAPQGTPQRSGQRQEGAAMPHYVLRFAAPQMALVEGAGRLWRVGRGDILPGAGRVVDITRRERNRWVVKTFDGRRMHEIGGQ